MSAGLSSVSTSSHPSKSSVIRKVGTGSFTENLPDQRRTKWGGGGLPKIKLTQFYYCCHTKAIGSNVCAKKNAPPWQDILSQNHTHTHLSVGYEAREFLVGRKSMEELPRATLTTNDRRYTNSETLDC